MRRISWPSFAVGAMVSAVVVGAPATGLVRVDGAVGPEAVDNTAPALTVAPARFVTRASIDAAGAPGRDRCERPLVWNTAIPLKMTWRASDGAGSAGAGRIAGYDVWAAGSGVGFDRVVAGTRATSYEFRGGNYDGTVCGEGTSVDDSYWVVATDAAGNWAASRRGSATEWVDVWQEDGSPPEPQPGGVGALEVTRTGEWTVSECSCANGGSTLLSEEKGATLTYRLVTERPGQTVGLVAATGPGHGRAYVRVDTGVFRSVNLTADRPRDRVVVWQQTLPPGAHTVEVVNAGTEQQPRVEVDSVLLTRAVSAMSAMSGAPD